MGEMKIIYDALNRIKAGIGPGCVVKAMPWSNPDGLALITFKGDGDQTLVYQMVIAPENINNFNYDAITDYIELANKMFSDKANFKQL